MAVVLSARSEAILKASFLAAGLAACILIGSSMFRGEAVIAEGQLVKAEEGLSPVQGRARSTRPAKDPVRAQLERLRNVDYQRFEDIACGRLLQELRERYRARERNFSGDLDRVLHCDPGEFRCISRSGPSLLLELPYEGTETKEAGVLRVRMVKSEGQWRIDHLRNLGGRR